MKNRFIIIFSFFFFVFYIAHAQTWSYVGQKGFTAGPAYASKILVKNDTTYVAFIGVVYTPPFHSNIRVMYFDGTNWQPYGPNVTNDTSFQYIMDFKTNSSGEFYIAYADKFAGNKVSVKKLDGTNWVYVGNQGFSPNATENKVAMDIYNDTPYVAIMEKITNFQQDVIVMKFDGANWVSVGSNKVSTSAILYDLKVVNGVPYVAYQSSGKFHLAYFDGTNWVKVNNGPLYYGTLNSVGYNLDSYGDTLYIPFHVEYLNNITRTFFLARYNAATQQLDTMQIIRGGIDIDNYFEKLELNKDGDIFFVKYAGPSSNGKREIIRYDRNNNSLSVYGGQFPVGLSMEYLDMAFDNNNKPYVVFKDEEITHRLSVCSFGNISSVQHTSNNLHQIFIYPNPNDGHFILQSQFDEEITLHDVTGKLLDTFFVNENEVFVYRHLLSPGCYLLKGKATGIQKKLIVQ